ncbi:DUF6521 family protein [Paraburkholderia xenovorans]|uniref:three component ABC system middle component n=1 Tax=Paraburkholderia xenovorans TaxID=36873 RepID=UPI0038BA04B6
MNESWSGYNNIGICATALMSVIERTGELPLAKALLVMPLVMHDATLAFLSNANVRKREAAALTSVRPELFANFNNRFEDSLVLSLNAVQLLIHLGHVKLRANLVPDIPMDISPDFGARAQRIVKAAPSVAALLASPIEELYLNFRVHL